MNGHTTVEIQRPKAAVRCRKNGNFIEGRIVTIVADLSHGAAIL